MPPFAVVRILDIQCRNGCANVSLYHAIANISTNDTCIGMVSTFCSPANLAINCDMNARSIINVVTCACVRIWWQTMILSVALTLKMEAQVKRLSAPAPGWSATKRVAAAWTPYALRQTEN